LENHKEAFKNAKTKAFLFDKTIGTSAMVTVSGVVGDPKK
jgi:hypothetical protein